MLRLKGRLLVGEIAVSAQDKRVGPDYHRFKLQTGLPVDDFGVESEQLMLWKKVTVSVKSRRSCAAIAMLSLPLVLVAAGCQRQSPDDPPVQVRDSAGVTIVESRAPAWGEGESWRVGTDALVVIGALEGDRPYLFERIAGATRTSDGRIVVVEGGTREIRVFDSAGRHLLSFGGDGEGPGEFRRAPDILIVPPDTLIALDRTAFRYSWSTLDGTLVRDAPFPRDSVTENFGSVSSRDAALLSSDGSFFHVGRFAPSNTEMREFDGFFGYRPIPDEIAQSDIRLGLVYNKGEREVVLGRYPRYEGGYVEGPTGPGPGSAMRIDNDHYPAVQFAVERDPVRVHISTPGRREIRTFDGEGQPIRILRQSTPLEPLTQGVIDAFREQVRDSAAKRDIAPGAIMNLFDQIAFPDSVFPYSRIVPDAAGNLWVLEHELEDDPATATYQVFDVNGLWLGPVRVPWSGGTTIEEIGEDYILAVRTDEFDVPYVELYEIVKTPYPE